jgi:5-methyltetrahydrofolate--homocysteine methyltransferase
MQEMFETLRAALMGAKREAALEATQALLDQGVDPSAILQEGLAAAMLELGERWKRGEVYLPEVVAAATLFKKCNDLVEPALVASGAERKRGALVVTATVKGDLHDLGKNMVGAMLKTAGFEVHDLGKDVATETIVEAVAELQPSIVGLSALLTTTVPQQRTVIEALRARGLTAKVMVGGAPVTEEWAAEIGADGFAPNAPEAVSLALKLIAP